MCIPMKLILIIVIRISIILQRLQSTLQLEPEIRQQNAELARRALDKLRPEVIKLEWLQLINEIS